MEREKALDSTLASIDKQFGKGSVMRMGDKPSMAIDTIPTGALALDLALGVGGLPRGRVVEIFGPESSGKSTLAMHVVAEANAALELLAPDEDCALIASQLATVPEVD